MLLWTGLYQLSLALVCDRLIRLPAKRLLKDARRKGLLPLGLNLSWSPLIMSANERTGPVQFILAVTHFDTDQLQVAPLWQQGLFLTNVFLTAWYFVYPAKALPLPPRSQVDQF